MDFKNKSAGILLTVILTVMLSGSIIFTLLIEKLEGNITTDYPVVYREDLDRLLGEDWTILGKQYGYDTVIPYNIVTNNSWKIGFKDIDGQELAIPISNVEDRSMSAPFGYCMEMNFQDMVGSKYARDVISAVAPAACWDSGYWFQLSQNYTSGDNILEWTSTSDDTDETPIVEVALRPVVLQGDTKNSIDWENPELDFSLYDIDYANIFREYPDRWYLLIRVLPSSWDFSEEEYADIMRGMEETVGQIMDQINNYTGHTANMELIFPFDSNEEDPRFNHWYVINGELMEKKVSKTLLGNYGYLLYYRSVKFDPMLQE